MSDELLRVMRIGPDYREQCALPKAFKLECRCGAAAVYSLWLPDIRASATIVHHFCSVHAQELQRKLNAALIEERYPELMR